MSVDGYIAPQGIGLTDPDKTAVDAWLARWSQLQDWVFHQDFFRKNLHLPGQGEAGEDNKLLREVFNRTGTTIIGKRMFEAGERRVAHRDFAHDSRRRRPYVRGRRFWPP